MFPFLGSDLISPKSQPMSGNATWTLPLGRPEDVDGGPVRHVHRQFVGDGKNEPGFRNPFHPAYLPQKTVDTDDIQGLSVHQKQKLTELSC